MGLHQSRIEREHPADQVHALADLRSVSAQIVLLKAEQDRLIDLCLDHRLSERRIGAAAGMTGPAIHYRKKERAS